LQRTWGKKNKKEIFFPWQPRPRLIPNRDFFSLSFLPVRPKVTSFRGNLNTTAVHPELFSQSIKLGGEIRIAAPDPILIDVLGKRDGF